MNILNKPRHAVHMKAPQQCTLPMREAQPPCPPQPVPQQVGVNPAHKELQGQFNRRMKRHEAIVRFISGGTCCQQLPWK